MKPVALVPLLLGAATAMQQPTFRSTAALVRIEVSVTDDHGPVEGLKAGDFVLTDIGAIQRPAVYQSKDTPLDLVAISNRFSPSVRPPSNRPRASPLASRRSSTTLMNAIDWVCCWPVLHRSAYAH